MFGSRIGKRSKYVNTPQSKWCIGNLWPSRLCWLTLVQGLIHGTVARTRIQFEGDLKTWNQLSCVMTRLCRVRSCLALQKTRLSPHLRFSNTSASSTFKSDAAGQSHIIL
jgi:hypothetical protein